MSRLVEAENRLEQVLHRLESAVDTVVATRDAQRAELQAAVADKKEVKAQAGDLAQRLENAVARLKAATTETV